MEGLHQRKESQDGTVFSSDTQNKNREYADMPALLHREDDASSTADSRFVRLLEAQRAFLLRNAICLVRNSSLAEDLVQETLLRAYKARSSFEPDSNLSAWLSCIQRNTFINRKRKEGANPAANFIPINDLRLLDVIGVPENRPDLDPERIFFQNHVEPRIMHAIEELPARFRTPFVLREFNGLAYDDVSRTLGIPLGTMKSRVFRARALLRARLES